MFQLKTHECPNIIQVSGIPEQIIFGIVRKLKKLLQKLRGILILKNFDDLNMKKTNLFSLTIVFLFVFSVAMFSPALGVPENTNQTDDPIKIGVFIQETGALTVYSPWVKQGFELGLIYATDNTNQTEDGRDYEIHYYDTTGVGSAVTAIATDAIETDGIDILVGGISSSVAPNIMQVAADYGKLYFAGPAADAEITASLFDKHTFRVARNSYHDAKAGIYHSMDVVGAKKIAFLALDHPFGYTGVAAMQTEVVKRGGQVVATEYAPYGTVDFSSYLTRLNTEATTGRIDMLHIIWAGSFTGLWADIATYNVGTNMNISGVAIDILSMNALEAALKPLGGTIVGTQGLCVYGYQLPDNPVNDWMVQEHIERNIMPNGQYGLTYRVPELFTASSFGSAQFLVNVTNTVSDLQIDKMIAHLEGLNITTPKGPTYLRPNDHQGLAEMYIADVVNDTDPTSETYNLIIAKLSERIPALECAPPVATNYIPYPVVETSILRTPGFELVLAIFAAIPVAYYKKKNK